MAARCLSQQKLATNAPAKDWGHINLARQQKSAAEGQFSGKLPTTTWLTAKGKSQERTPHHVDEGDVEKHARRKHEDPRRDGMHASNCDANHHAGEAEDARENVVEEGHFHGHASLQQHREISWKKERKKLKILQGSCAISLKFASRFALSCFVLHDVLAAACVRP